MRTLLLVASGAVFLYFGSGCVSPMKFHGSVIERSKKTAPIWIDLAPNVFHQVKGEFLSLVSVKEYVIDMPLGVRQAEILAYERAKDLLFKNLRTALIESARERGKPLVSSRDLDREIRKEVDAVDRWAFKTVDLYYEVYDIQKKSGATSQNYASVFVLLYLPVSDREKCLRHLMALLS